MPHTTEISFALIAILILLSFVLKNETAKIRVRQVLLLTATFVVASFYYSVLTGKTTSVLKDANQAEKAEVPLKCQSTLNVGLVHLYKYFKPLQDSDGKEKQALELSNTGMTKMMETACRMLETALPRTQDPLIIKAKILVVAGSGKLRKPDTLSEYARDLQNSDKYRELGMALKAAFIDHSVASSQTEQFAKAIIKGLPKGWYQDNALLAVYKLGNAGDFAKLSGELEEKYWLTCVRVSAAFVIGVIAFFVGCVALVIQVGSISSKDHKDWPESELPRLNIDLKTVFTVFVAWQAIEVLIGSTLKHLPKGTISMGTEPLGVALFILVSYLVNMVPALGCVYFLALKPRGWPLFSTLKLRWRTATSGPWRLLLTGIFSWCATVPLVVVMSLIASAVFKSQGSENPIVGQILSAASNSHIVAILILYFTVAGLAPFFEETVFRGFLYASLRNRLGVFAAMVLSSFVFAAIHLDRSGFPMLFAIGFTLSVCFERSRSLYPCMLAHSMWNGGTLLLSLALMAN